MIWGLCLLCGREHAKKSGCLQQFCMILYKKNFGIFYDIEIKKGLNCL